MSLVDRIIGVESGGDPNASNPRSSASGLGQFIDSTWLSTIRAARPDLVQGRSDADLLALKSDPQLSREMTEAYAAQNGKVLSDAGLPVTAGTTYLAHFAGPQGAVSVLKADPSAPVSSVLTPGAIEANPFLRGMSVADLRAWADRKMGGGSAPAAARAPSAAVPAQPGSTSAPAPAQAVPEQPAAPSSGAGGYFASLPAEALTPLPIFTPQLRQVDLSKLKAAFASGNRGFIFGKS